MLPFDIQELLKGNSVRIVIDNAKSHGSSRIKRRRVETPESHRRMSEPLLSAISVATTLTPANKNTSRWDSAPSPAPSLPKKARSNIRDHAPQRKFSSTSPPSQTTCTSRCNVSKPVRRTSGEKTTLSISLSLNEKCTNKGLSTAELISKVLDEVHLFDDEGDDDDDDADTVASVISAPARLVTG